MHQARRSMATAAEDTSPAPARIDKKTAWHSMTAFTSKRPNRIAAVRMPMLADRRPGRPWRTRCRRRWSRRCSQTAAPMPISGTCIELSRIGHRDAETERDPQVGLWQREEALGERIADGNEQAHDRQKDRQPVQLAARARMRSEPTRPPGSKPPSGDALRGQRPLLRVRATCGSKSRSA